MMMPGKLPGLQFCHAFSPLSLCCELNADNKDVKHKSKKQIKKPKNPPWKTNLDIILPAFALRRFLSFSSRTRTGYIDMYFSVGRVLTQLPSRQPFISSPGWQGTPSSSSRPRRPSRARGAPCRSSTACASSRWARSAGPGCAAPDAGFRAPAGSSAAPW